MQRRTLVRRCLLCDSAGILPHSQPLIGRESLRYSLGEKKAKHRKLLMPSLTRVDLESLLRARKLDRTLTTTLLPPRGGEAVAPTGLSALDARLGGGFPRGQLSELVGPRSSGRTSLLLRLLATATARGELVALVDALDMFDTGSAVAAGLYLPRLLWIRGHLASHVAHCRDRNPRALEQAIKAFTLVLQAGNFGLVALDLGETPPGVVRRLPFTTWLRLQRIIEGSLTACVLVAPEPLARSAGGLTLRLEVSNSACDPREHSESFSTAVGAPPPTAAVSRICARQRPPALSGMGRASESLQREAPGVGPRRQEEYGAPRALEKGLGARFRGRLFDGLDIDARIVRAHARWQEQGDVRVPLSTATA